MHIQSFHCPEQQFLAIYVTQLHLFEENHFYFVDEAPFIIQWRSKAGQQEHFWHVTCKEVIDDHQFFITPAYTPEPFRYTVTDAFYKNQHAIDASSYHQADSTILQILFVGFMEHKQSVVQHIILQFEQHHLHLEAGPIVTVKKHKGQFDSASIHPDLMVLSTFL